MGGHGSGRKPEDNPARTAALSLMGQGLCTPADITALTGLERVTAAHWAKKAGIDWRKARNARLATLWRKEIAQ